MNETLGRIDLESGLSQSFRRSRVGGMLRHYGLSGDDYSVATYGETYPDGKMRRPLLAATVARRVPSQASLVNQTMFF